jgi:hypothetical protein
MRAVGPRVVGHVVSEHGSLLKQALSIKTPGDQPLEETLVKEKGRDIRGLLGTSLTP